MALTTCTIGFPRIGRNREIKTALEKYWKQQLPLAELLAVRDTVQASAWQEQLDLGINLVGADGTLYDQMLDTTFMLGIVPKRFQHLSSFEQYFAMARGTEGAVALDMSKWFDTNYHFLVPELEDGWQPAPDFSHTLDKLRRCQEVVGVSAAVPAIIGPITFASLARQPGTAQPLSTQQVVARLLPAYITLLRELKALKVPEVQVHEPYLVTTKGAALKEVTTAAYEQLAAVGLPIQLTTYYDDLGEAYPWVVALPVAGVSLDFLGVPGAATPNQTLQLVRTHGFPRGKRLVAGVIDGRSVWADNGIAASIVGELLSKGLDVAVTSSAPLQHLPFDVGMEKALPASLCARLGFAVQKVAEIVTTARQAKPAPECDLSRFQPSELSFEIEAAKFSRPAPFETRRGAQVQMPAFPTTSIGSFPQTAEVRRLRLQRRQGRISQDAYEEGIAAQIGYAIGAQEALGLDVLVHGEAERTDMVEYFGENLEGMAFTQHGWVQSYGSRYVRPPLVVSDIAFVKPMTVKEFQLAQSLTPRPVKGMLTGPVTILNWSFPRRDITRRAQALQLGLALRQEVAALEAAGCRVVQVDDPALREGLPLKAQRWAPYLTWAVDAFRLCTAVAAPKTQVVTHLCYSDFEDILGAINDMDADVLTIENSRSGDEMVRALAGAGYGRDLGPGVYDVHSPVVPTVEFMKDKLRSFLATGVLSGRADRLWVNPDCGLKTRGWAETLPSLRNMVQAAAELREELKQQGGDWKGVARGIKNQAALTAAAALPKAACAAGCC